MKENNKELKLVLSILFSILIIISDKKMFKTIFITTLVVYIMYLLTRLINKKL